MPTLRLAHAVALAAVLSACGDHLPSTPTAPSAAPAAPGPAQIAPEVAPAAPGSGPAAVAPSNAAPSSAQSAPSAPSAPSAQSATSPAAGVAAASASPGSDGSPATARAPQGGSTGGPGALPAPASPAPAPVATVIKEALAVAPGGAALPLTSDRDTVVDPGARFEVALSVASPDARLVLIDFKDALVAGAEAHEVGQGTRLTLAPSAPLAPGRRYTLRVDGAATRELHDAGGKAFTPSVLTIRVAGATLPEPKELQSARRKRRR